MDENIVETGLHVRGHPLLLGPRPDGKKADKRILTELDRFLTHNYREELYWPIRESKDGVIVKGAAKRETFCIGELFNRIITFLRSKA